VAFADYSAGFQPFHHTQREAFLQATAISSFSLVEMVEAFKPYLTQEASIVALSISDLNLSAEKYGYMSPIKAALEGCVRFLAKSLSHDSRIRVNCVKAGPLKTSASAGIPGYLDHYLYAEALTYRKAALKTQEVANTALFLLSEASSGINGQGIIVDAGLSQNVFDQNVVDRFNATHV
jgi:enoyl-[acyl-carrier protein] reductase I